MIKYLGSKRTLIPAILEVIQKIQPTGTIIDLFSGTSRVGHALKKSGYQVYSNDHNAYAHTIATCYVQADAEDHLHTVENLIKEFNQIPGKPGYFTESFCIKSRFFQQKNGARIDAIREEIDRKEFPPELKAILIVALMEAADRVDSTTGIQMAYLKQWAPRANNELELRVPDIIKQAKSGKSQAFLMDALEATDQLNADIGYFDPPYNQHKYLGNYHIWETLTLWDKPELYGVACKRVDCTKRISKFNARKDSREAMQHIIENSKTQHLVVSFNNEGYLSKQDIEELLSPRGDVIIIEHDFKRYVGAQIGIHNPSGAKVGEVSHLRNTEYLYVASKDKNVLERVREIKSGER